MNSQKVHLPSELRQELRECFEALDVNRSGALDLKEIAIALRAMGFEPRRDEVRSMVDTIVRQSISTGGKTFSGTTRIKLRAPPT